jgi:hypothetical protein
MTSPQEQQKNKFRITGPVVVTANRLADGAVVYRTADGRWATRLDDATVVDTTPDAMSLLAAGRADKNSAVDVYVAPVERGAGGAIKPGNLREAIRQSGPTFELPFDGH